MDGMAKVFKAGTISVGGDQIRLTSKGTDEFAFTDSSGSDLFSTAIYDSEVSSLAYHQNLDTVQRSSDISSLDIVKDSEVSSLDSAISALDNALQVATVDVSNSVNTQTFTWEALFGANSGFSATTKVMVMVKAAQGADLIACQMAGIDGTGFTVDFSEGTGTGDAYDLIVMASN